ncbi:hypothetical protein GW17_00033101 [Ensete ventricosum]|nr:hypothetical protein GW17_00033101 [Ensete ventricosum]
MAAEGSESGAAVMEEEEEGSSNVGCGCGATLWLQVEMVAAKVRLRQRDEGAAECTAVQRRTAAVWSERPLLVVFNLLLAAIKEVGSERSLLVAFVPQEIAAGCDQGGWQREITAGSVVQRRIAAGRDQGRWQRCAARDACCG